MKPNNLDIVTMQTPSDVCAFVCFSAVSEFWFCKCLPMNLILFTSWGFFFFLTKDLFIFEEDRRQLEVWQPLHRNTDATNRFDKEHLTFNKVNAALSEWIMWSVRCSKTLTARHYWLCCFSHDNFVLSNLTYLLPPVVGLSPWLRNWNKTSQNVDIWTERQRVIDRCIVSRRFRISDQIWSWLCGVFIFISIVLKSLSSCHETFRKESKAFLNISS